MFSDFTGSFREIMAAISARKSGRIDSCYGNIFIRGVEQVHGLSEGDPKIESIRQRNFWSVVKWGTTERSRIS